jgi:putative SOS response-associated peptidase YedK
VVPLHVREFGSPARRLAFFAGIWTPQWKSVRMVKEGETINDLFAFLTTDPNRVVSTIHPKAMPVILKTPEEIASGLERLWRVSQPVVHGQVL